MQWGENMDSETQVQIIRISLHILAFILVFIVIWYRNKKIIMKQKNVAVIGFLTGLVVWIFYFFVRSYYYTFSEAHALHFSDLFILIRHIIIEGIIGLLVFVILITVIRIYLERK